MGQWSRVLVLSSLVAALPAWAQGHAPGGQFGGQFGGYAGMGHAGPTGRPISGPGTVPNPGQLPAQPFGGSRPLLPSIAEQRHPRRDGAVLVGGGGPGFTTYGGDLAPTEGPDEGGYGPPPPYVIPGIGAPLRRPCVAPQIIKIGRGLRQPASMRVIYGAPPCPYP